MYLGLVEPLKRLVLDVQYVTHRSVSTVQALLLLCYWEGIAKKTWTDLSWAYCGIATNAALQMGLHRPHHAIDFIYDASFDDETRAARRKTWVACFIVNQRYVMTAVPNLTDKCTVSAVGWGFHAR